MPWVGYSDATVFTSIGSVDLPGATEVAFLCSNHPTFFTLVNACLWFGCHGSHSPFTLKIIKKNYVHPVEVMNLSSNLDNRVLRNYFPFFT
jgi:hypothetical protein